MNASNLLYKSQDSQENTLSELDGNTSQAPLLNRYPVNHPDSQNVTIDHSVFYEKNLYPQMDYSNANLDFAPPVEEVSVTLSSFADETPKMSQFTPVPVANNLQYSQYVPAPMTYTNPNMYYSYQQQVNPNVAYQTMTNSYYPQGYASQNMTYSVGPNVVQPLNPSVGFQPAGFQASLNQSVAYQPVGFVPQQPVQMANAHQMAASLYTNEPLQTSQKSSMMMSSSAENKKATPIQVQQSSVQMSASVPVRSTKLQGSKSVQGKKDYFMKTIENDLIKRTECVGNLAGGTYDFDDYFEQHIGKFFTPELDQIVFYHNNSHIYGLQVTYRDPWGKYDKETYKGNLHMSKMVARENCLCSTFTLTYDDYLTEIYVDGTNEISYLRFVTNEGKVFVIGSSERWNTLKNMVEPLTRIMGVGGSFDLCLNGIYFYYN